MNLKEKYDKIHETEIVTLQERFEFDVDNALYKMFSEININPNVVEEQQREIEELRELIENHLLPAVEIQKSEFSARIPRMIRALQTCAFTETHRMFLFPLLCSYENISVDFALDGIKYYGGFNHLYAELSKPYRGGDNHG